MYIAPSIAEAEVNYILSVDPQSPGSDFTDRACFVRYVCMQAAHMIRADYPHLATLILDHVIDQKYTLESMGYLRDGQVHTTR